MAKVTESKVTYILVGAILWALLGLSVGLAFLKLGPTISPFVALLIAAVQAAFVAFFCMHLRRSNPLLRVFATAGLLWLILLIGLTMGDFATRGPRLVPAKSTGTHIEKMPF